MYMAHREAHGVNLRMFWASHQRFFRALLMAFKVPDVAVEVRRALSITDVEDTRPSRKAHPCAPSVGLPPKTGV